MDGQEHTLGPCPGAHTCSSPSLEWRCSVETCGNRHVPLMMLTGQMVRLLLLCAAAVVSCSPATLAL